MKKGFLTNALVLSVGGVLAKVFSAIYRIGLTRILGSVGIGLYQLIFPLYSLCVVLATAGLPMAISKVVANNIGNEKAVLKKSLLFVSLVSLVLTLVLCVVGKSLAKVQGEESLSVCYYILAPSIIILSSTSVLRGYFQGKNNFTPSAISNISEQFVKLVVGLILSLVLINIGLIPAIIGAMISIVASEIVALIIMLLYFKKHKLKNKNNGVVTISELLKDILPITLTNIILPISSFIDSLIVVNLLSHNFSQEVSVFLYGIESGAVSSLISLPTIFSFAIASVILPSIASSSKRFNQSKKLNLAIKIVLIIAIPCVVCFIAIPNQLINILYSNRLNGLGINGSKIAVRLLALSGISVLFLAISQVYSSTLQAVNERYVTIRNLGLAVVLKFIIELIFLPSKNLNIFAMAFANIVCNLTVMTLNHFEIREVLKVDIDYNFWCKLILCNLFMLVSLITILTATMSFWNTILAVLVAIIVYLFSIYKFKVFTKKDLAMFKYKL